MGSLVEKAYPEVIQILGSSPTQTSMQTPTPTSSNSGINTYLTQFFKNNPAMLARLSNMSSNQGMSSSDIPSMVSHYNNLANPSDFVHAKHGGRIGYEQGKLVEPQAPSHNYRPSQLIQMYHDALSKGDEDNANNIKSDLFKEFGLTSFKNGGRIKKNMGGTLGQPEIYTPTQDTMMSRNIPNEGLMSIKLTPVNKKKGGKIIQHPVRMLEDGHSELDLRAKGGYIPIGKKERADDVPAMLSKNEFVFTADAVRNAGDGDVNKGAQKMYKLMKSLEGKIKRHG